MKLTLLQENFAKAVTQASRFASTRSQLPILGNILLSANKTKLNVSSTNLEVSVSTQIGAKIEEEGEISIPSKVITELITNLPKETITLDSEKEQLKVSATGYSSKILGMDSTDFPKIPNSVNKSSAINLNKKLLLESLPKVIFASGVDETRPVLTGVLFVLGKTGLTLVATDGFRLSKKKLPLKSAKEVNLIIPKGILNELLRTAEETEEVLIDLQEKEKQVLFGLDNVVITSRLLEGDYPEFEKIIPKSSVMQIRIDKMEFARAVKLASVFARESANVVKLKVSKDSVKVAAESSSFGSQETKVDAKTEGEFPKDFEISFNFRFLEEFLHSVTGDEVRMEFTTNMAAGVFLDTKDPDYLHLIMPVRVQG